MSKPPLRASTSVIRRVAWMIVCVHGLTSAHAASAEEEAPAPVPPAPGPAPPPLPGPMIPEAKAHYDRGLEHYAAHQYARAVDELKQGFAVEPRREFLFAEAQALRLAGDCRQAVPLYQQFIDSAPPALQMQAARLGLDRCGPDRSPGSGGVTPPVLTSPPPSSHAPPATPETAAWWRDPWGDLSIGVGVVALGVAAGFELASSRGQDHAARAATYAQYDQDWIGAQHRREIAVTALIGGAVLIATGGTRLLLLRGHAADESKSTHSDAHASLALTEGGAALLWRGAF